MDKQKRFIIDRLRSFEVLSVKAVSLITLIIVHLSSTINAQNDFNVVKQRVISEIMKTPVSDSVVSELVNTINNDGRWHGINYDDVSRTGFEHSTHLSHMVKMSIAFNNQKSKFYKNKKVNRLINSSLKLWCDNDYLSDNWWYNQIFTPLSLVTVLLVMDDNIDQKLAEKAIPIIGRAHLGAPGARPGGDRIKIGGIEAKKVLALGDQTRFGQITKAINDEIKFNTGGRGMQHDYSFHHRVDRVNTTYAYGKGYADAFAEWGAYVAGTEYAFSEENIKHLVDYYLDGICKQFVYGMYTDKGALNRSISRQETFKPHGAATPERLLKITDYRGDELQEIINLRKGNAGTVSSFCKFFWQSEYFVFQRPGFYTSVRLFSVRNRNIEKPYNSEGLKNHHKGDGTNFLSITGKEYLNIWPVYDWQKLPGTTVLQKPDLPSEEHIQKDGVTDFVGAVTNGLHGAVAFDFISPHDFTRARKSWFFFEDEYVCLGAGIESMSEFPVATTLDQALMQGEVVVAGSDNEMKLTRGEHAINDAKWVNHNGTGYIFPEPANIHITNKEEQGKWTDINRQWDSPKELIKKDVFKLWLDHGARPQGRPGGFNHETMIAKDVKYQYIVVPSIEPKNMNEDRGIEIMANNRLMQAVKNSKLGISQIVFYQAGEIRISDNMVVSLESPGVVMIETADASIKKITVADPSRKLSRLHIRISGRMEAKDSDNLKVIFDSQKMTSDLTIDLPAGFYAGQSVVLEF